MTTIEALKKIIEIADDFYKTHPKVKKIKHENKIYQIATEALASLEKDEDERCFEEILDYYNVTLEDNRRDESIRLAAFKYASQFKK